MNRNDLILQMEGTHKNCMSLMAGKSEDYASQLDTLANFKRVHILCQVLEVDPMNSAWDCAMFQIVSKIDRLCNLHKSGKVPKNEKTDDTIMDAHNYLDLCNALATEEASKQP